MTNKIKRLMIAGLAGLVLAGCGSKKIETFQIDGTQVTVDNYRGNGLSADYQEMTIRDTNGTIVLYKGEVSSASTGRNFIPNFGDPNTSININGYTFRREFCDGNGSDRYSISYPNGGLDKRPVVNDMVRQKLEFGVKLMDKYNHKIELQKFGNPKAFQDSLEQQMSKK